MGPSAFIITIHITNTHTSTLPTTKRKVIKRIFRKRLMPLYMRKAPEIPLGRVYFKKVYHCKEFIILMLTYIYKSLTCPCY